MYDWDNWQWHDHLLNVWTHTISFRINQCRYLQSKYVMKINMVCYTYVAWDTRENWTLLSPEITKKWHKNVKLNGTNMIPAKLANHPRWILKYLKLLSDICRRQNFFDVWIEKERVNFAFFNESTPDLIVPTVNESTVFSIIFVKYEKSPFIFATAQPDID